eukprot:TRINITY_DN135259_c1_g1_i1.p1 TRINITY_DN135259_c1_g1~~TRINITY_DN135259_c1_g1_i1.p1  ORF type:complete len:926 (+),score=101.21 TRINITY_DN135259_c1_g1_i1:106-2778(+)
MKEEPTNMTFTLKPATKKRTTEWKYFTQPLTVKEFHALNFYPHHLQSIGQKLADVKEKIPGQLIKDQLKTWFSALTPYNRVKVLTIRSPTLTWLIKHMYTRSVLFEHCMFSFTVHNSQLSYMETKEEWGSVKQHFANQRLVESVRITDDKEILDTFSISRDLASDPKALFSALDEVSNQKFGLKPCGIQRAGIFYTWEFPEWFDYSKKNPLGAWIAANFERLLWLSYGAKLSQFTIERVCAPLDLQAEILKFWKELQKEERYKILLEFLNSARNNPVVDKDYRSEAILKLHITAKECSEETFVDKLVFRALSEMCTHETRCTLLNIIKNKICNKATEELLEEQDKDKEKKDRKADLEEMDIGLLSGKKSGRYDYMYKEEVKEETACTERKKKKKKAKKRDVKPLNNQENFVKEAAKVGLKETVEDNKKAESEKVLTIEESNTRNKEEEAKEVVDYILNEIITELPLTIKSVEQVTSNPTTVPQKNRKKKKKHKKKPSKGPIISEHTKQANNKPKSPVNEATENEEKTQDLLDPTAIEKAHYLNSFSKVMISETYAYISDRVNSHCKEISQYNGKQSKYWGTLAKNIETLLKKCFRNSDAKVKIYGSAKTGLAIETSDLDLGIIGILFNNRKEVEEAIERLAKFITLENYVVSSEAILTARVPVLKLVTDLAKIVGEKHMNYLKVDITFNMPGEDQVERATKAADLSVKLMGKLHYLKEVVIFLKEYLADYELNIPYTGIFLKLQRRIGGISSYGLLLLTAAYYSIYPRFNSSGECLVRVLDFYANYFNNMLYGIYYDGNAVSYYPLTAPAYYSCLVIVDPFSPQSNITASLYRFDAIRGCFCKLLASLTSSNEIQFIIQYRLYILFIRLLCIRHINSNKENESHHNRKRN